MSSQVSEIADDLSNLSHTLHPSRLETLGLTALVRLLCREISQLRQVNVQFRSVELPHQVDPGVALCLYRIAQEALHNIAKHSRPCDASVHLTHERDQVHLHIEDSGVGFDLMVVDGGGLGLLSMLERVGILKGQLVINASPWARDADRREHPGVVTERSAIALRIGVKFARGASAGRAAVCRGALPTSRQCPHQPHVCVF